MCCDTNTSHLHTPHTTTCHAIFRFRKFAVPFRMRKTVAGFLSIICLGLIGLDSCVYHDFPEYVCSEEISFANHVQPILSTKCAISGCHNGDMGPDLNWTNFEQFGKRVQSGLVKYRVTHGIMPPSYSPEGPLTQEQINTIACWSDQGGLNN